MSNNINTTPAKRTTIWILALLLITLIAAGGTLSYYRAQSQRKNTFATGTIAVNINEPNWNDDLDGKELRLGSTRIKDPTLVAWAGEVYVRFRVEVRDMDDNTLLTGARLQAVLDTLYYDPSYIYTGTADDDATKNIVKGDSYTTAELAGIPGVQKGYNHTNLDFIGTLDGHRGVLYFAYKDLDDIFVADKANPANSDVVTLFTNVVIPAEWGNEVLALLEGDHGNGYYITIRGEMIQANNIASRAEAFALLDGDAKILAAGESIDYAAADPF